MDENERLPGKMSIGDVLDYTIEVYKKNFKRLTVLALIFYVPFMFLYTALTSYLSADFMSLMNVDGYMDNMEDPSSYMYRILAFYGSMSVMGIIYFIYSITLKPVMDSAIIRTVYDNVVHGKSEDVKTVIRKSFGKFPTLLVNSLLYSLIVFGVSMVVVVVFYILIFVAVFAVMLSVGVTAGTDGVLNVVMGVIVAILVLVFLAGAGLLVGYFTVKFMFGLHAVTIEGKSATGGLSRSSELTRKNFWHVFLTYVLGYILIFSLPQALGVGAYVFIFLDKNLHLMANVAAQIINAIIYPFATTLLTMLFINLKIKKEGLDLEVKVDILLEGQKKRDGIVENA